MFFVLLISIPFFALKDQLFIAKIIGIVTVITLSVALWVWKNQSAKLSGVKNRVRLNLNDRFWLNQNCPFYSSLSKTDKQAFTDRAGLFLGNCSIRLDEGMELSKEDYIAIASSFVISTWHSFTGTIGFSKEVFIINSSLGEQSTKPPLATTIQFEIKDILGHIKSSPEDLLVGKNPWTVEM